MFGYREKRKQHSDLALSLHNNQTDLSAEVDRCLSGDKLYGDDFSPAEIEEWFRDEEEGYYSLGSKKRDGYVYGYHALNWLHGYSALPSSAFHHVLGIGSAYGDDLLPVVGRASRITILEPSEGFCVSHIGDVPVEFVKPNPSGALPFPNCTFDLITCLAVLHHIPNVSTVVREMYRCLLHGGYALVREPIISMGDWRQPRKGLTKRERGIPFALLRNMISYSGFRIVKETKCMFPITSRARHLLRSPVYNSRLCTYIDSVICRLPVWSESYHPSHVLHKLQPNSIFFVLQRP